MYKINFLSKLFYHFPSFDPQYFYGDLDCTVLRQKVDYEIIYPDGLKTILIKKGSYTWVPDGIEHEKRKFKKFVFPKDCTVDPQLFTDFSDVRCCVGINSDTNMENMKIYRGFPYPKITSSASFGAFDTYVMSNSRSILLNPNTNLMEIGNLRFNDNPEIYDIVSIPFLIFQYGKNTVDKVVPIEKVIVSYDAFTLREISSRLSDLSGIDYFGPNPFREKIVRAPVIMQNNFDYHKTYYSAYALSHTKNYTVNFPDHANKRLLRFMISGKGGTPYISCTCNGDITFYYNSFVYKNKTYNFPSMPSDTPRICEFRTNGVQHTFIMYDLNWNVLTSFDMEDNFLLADSFSMRSWDNSGLAYSGNCTINGVSGVSVDWRYFRYESEKYIGTLFNKVECFAPLNYHYFDDYNNNYDV